MCNVFQANVHHGRFQAFGCPYEFVIKVQSAKVSIFSTNCTTPYWSWDCFERVTRLSSVNPIQNTCNQRRCNIPQLIEDVISVTYSCISVASRANGTLRTLSFSFTLRDHDCLLICHFAIIIGLVLCCFNKKLRTP